MFDPKAHLIQLPRRVKDPITGQWVTRSDDYLEVRWRLVWFREKYPHGSITTEAVMLDWEKGIAIYKATVGDGEGGVATGTGTETRKSFEDFVEKAETRSIGRALAALGIGTQFVGEELSEGEHVADAPVSPERRQQMVEEVATTAVNILRPDLANGSTPAPAPEPERLNQEAIDRLFQVALKGVGEPKEAFASRIRTLMRLPGSQLISKAYLQRSMTVEQYGAAMAYYELQLKQQVEADVPDHDPPPSDAVPLPQDALEATQPPPGETIDATPEGAVVDPDAEVKAKLKAEAMGWALSVPEREIDYILEHYSPEKARAMLWNSRKPKVAHPPQPTLTESAA
jgi:hypothetical protein